MTMRRLSLNLAVTLVLLSLSTLAEAKDKGEEDTEYWGNFSLAPKVGYVGFIDFRDAAPLGDRHGFNLNVNFDFGGKGRGFDVAFFYSYEDVDTYGGINAIGGYMGGSYRFQFGRAYPYIGMGTKIGYGFSDFTDHHIELTAKIPMGMTYYILDDLGIVVEFGLGYNTSFYKMDTLAVWGWWFTHGLYLDAMVGIRWP